jgi:hypothetical protein
MTRTKLPFVWVALLALPLLAGLCKGETKSEESRLETMVAELESCPDWVVVPKEDVVARKRITDTYVKLARESTESIRAGMALFLKRHPGPSVGNIQAEDKLFAFVRVVFIVPQRYVPQPSDPSSTFFAFGNPVYSDGADLLWPYSIDGTGQLALTGVDTGMHTGPIPDALSDFDKMASRFSRRFPHTPK